MSPEGGTKATGPGDRYNACERIWCFSHGQNFAIEHFLTGHTGWIIHDDERGDIFVQRGRNGGPEFPDAHETALYLCGLHIHPFILGKYGGSIRHTGYNLNLGYSRSHFNRWGMALDPCCLNGLGFGFIHSIAGRQFRFHDLDDYRAHPDQGWQSPVVAHFLK